MIDGERRAVGTLPPQESAARARPEHPRSVLVLVFGILGIIALPILAPFAWRLGRSAINEARRTQAYNSGGMLRAGYVLGVIGTLLLALVVLVGLALLLVVLAQAGVLPHTDPTAALFLVGICSATLLVSLGIVAD
ncbi:hypothetical protein CGZ93_08460 [Enemella dayhoffiae]|uniref:DUF4190 domain-containing protein n=1 Tax=Enemella dayhoffiae TaxID=2016507 RepID=A0A255H2J3_9ACTN|nr:hypothetical protein [Enemella dayhoffiae]OYO21958.1 hypothetical protein CGZ93_08460 [Enemella dayhoffiae]